MKLRPGKRENRARARVLEMIKEADVRQARYEGYQYGAYEMLDAAFNDRANYLFGRAFKVKIEWVDESPTNAEKFIADQLNSLKDPLEH